MIKQMMMRGMDAVMLSCEEATFQITKSEFEKLGCIKQVQLKMHLAGCELCRRFKVQSEIINEGMKKLENLKMHQDLVGVHLSNKKKEELKEIITRYNNLST